MLLGIGMDYWVGNCCDMGALSNRRVLALWVLDIVVKIERMVVLSLALQS